MDGLVILVSNSCVHDLLKFCGHSWLSSMVGDGKQEIRLYLMCQLAVGLAMSSMTTALTSGVERQNSSRALRLSFCSAMAGSKFAHCAILLASSYQLIKRLGSYLLYPSSSHAGRNWPWSRSQVRVFSCRCSGDDQAS